MSVNENLLEEVIKFTKLGDMSEIENLLKEIKKILINGKDMNPNVLRAAYILLDYSYRSGRRIDGAKGVVSSVINLLSKSNQYSYALLRGSAMFVKDLLFITDDFKIILEGYSTLFLLLRDENTDDSLKIVIALALVDLCASWLIESVKDYGIQLSDEVLGSLAYKYNILGPNYRIISFITKVLYNSSKKKSRIANRIIFNKNSASLDKVSTLLFTLDFPVFTEDIDVYLKHRSIERDNANLSYSSILIDRINYYTKILYKSSNFDRFNREFKIAFKEVKYTDLERSINTSYIFSKIPYRSDSEKAIYLVT